MAAHTKIDLYQMQSLPLDAKIRMTARRIDAFIDRNDAYLSISGGKDSRVLDDIERRFVNYGYGDYHLVLDYIRRKGEPDRTPEQMRQDIDVFLRECRKEYRKAGLEFKYIHVMEIGNKGARHHHLVVNKIDTEILQRCWYKAYEGHNRVKVFPLDDSGNYAELASYLIKYTGTHKKGTDGALQGKRWNCSKNLVRPEPEYRIISDREYFKKEPKAIKGYYVDKNSVSMGVHSPEYYGYGYLRYTLVKITDRGG